MTNGEFAPLSVVWNISRHRQVFLNTEITLKNDVITLPHLESRLYRKPMNTHMYIPWLSAYPITVKRSFVKAELTRFAIICSEELGYLQAVDHFFAHLKRCGYPLDTLNT